MIIPAITARPRKRFGTQHSPNVVSIRCKNRDVMRTTITFMSSIERNVVEHIALFIIRLHLNPHTLALRSIIRTHSRKFGLLIPIERLRIALIIFTRIIPFM